jgi:hypothetical protein
MKWLKVGKTVGGKVLLPAEFAYEMGSNSAEGQGIVEASVNGVSDMVKGLGWVVMGALDYVAEGTSWATGGRLGGDLVKDTDEEGGVLMKWLSSESNYFDHENVSDKKSMIGTSRKRGEELQDEAENKYGAVDVGWGKGQIEDEEELSKLSVEHLDALLFNSSWKKKDEDLIKKIMMSKQQGKEIDTSTFNDGIPFNQKLKFDEEFEKEYNAIQLKLKEEKEKAKKDKRAELKAKDKRGQKRNVLYTQGEDSGMDDTMGEDDAGRASSDFVIQGQLNQAIQYQHGSQAEDIPQLASNAVLTGQAGSAVYVDSSTHSSTTNQGDHIVASSTAHAPNLPFGNGGSLSFST